MKMYTIAETRTYQIIAVSEKAALATYKAMTDEDLAPYFVAITDSEVL